MLRDEILLLRKQGMSYNAISTSLNCSKATVSYHLGDSQKEKARLRHSKRMNSHPFLRKIELFSRSVSWQESPASKAKLVKSLNARIRKFSRMKRSYTPPLFTVDDVLEKIGDSPTCYLTGRPIDIYDTKSYHFDHIVPRSRGGNNSLENLGLASADANYAKSNLSLEDFYRLCKEVVDHLGPQFEPRADESFRNRT